MYRDRLRVLCELYEREETNKITQNSKLNHESISQRKGIVTAERNAGSGNMAKC